MTDQEIARSLVTVVMAVRNEAQTIRESLRAVLGQTFPPDRMEVIVADGLSDDSTRDLILEIAAGDRRVRLIDNPGQIVSTGLNAAIRSARGSIIARMDGHTAYAPDYLSECVRVLGETGADCVGGPWRARGTGYTQRAIALAFQSRFSSGGARSHDVAYEGPVDSVYLGCWRKSTLDRVGRFDEELVRNQDDELSLRLVKGGGTVWQSPAITSWYRPRASISGVFRQYAQYGYWKVRVIQKHRLPAAARHLAPGGFVALLATLTMTALFVPAAAWGLMGLVGLYGTALLVASSATAGPAHAWRLLPVLPPVFAAFHLGYGYGFLRGILDFIVLRGRRSKSFTRLTRSAKPVVRDEHTRQRTGEQMSAVPECPRCHAARLHRTPAQSRWDRIRKRLTRKRRHRCFDCGWIGWMTSRASQRPLVSTIEPASPNFVALDAAISEAFKDR